MCSGIGSFTIVDGQKVTSEDVGNKYVHIIYYRVEHNLANAHIIMMQSLVSLHQLSVSYTGK